MKLIFALLLLAIAFVVFSPAAQAGPRRGHARHHRHHHPHHHHPHHRGIVIR